LRGFGGPVEIHSAALRMPFPGWGVGERYCESWEDADSYGMTNKKSDGKCRNGCSARMTRKATTEADSLREWKTREGTAKARGVGFLRFYISKSRCGAPGCSLDRPPLGRAGHFADYISAKCPTWLTVNHRPCDRKNHRAIPSPAPSKNRQNARLYWPSQSLQIRSSLS